MIRNLLATSAIATLLATSALAQETTTPAPADPAAPAEEDAAPAAPATEQAAQDLPAEGHLGTKLIGESVYNGTGDDAENIGNVNDLVISEEGQVAAVVVGVGGFLGIGDKNVALDFSKMEWVDQDGDQWLVTDATKESLEALPEFDPAPYEPTPPPAATDTGAPAGTAPTTAPTTTE